MTMFRPSSFILSAWVSVLLCGCPAGDDGVGDTSSTSGTSGDTSGDTTSDATSEDSTGADETGSGLSGEELYLAVCAPCHGMSGEGTALGYEVQHPVRIYSDWVVRNGRPGTEFEGSAMAAYDPSVASDTQLEEIWDYLDTFPQPTTGEGLYLDYCRNCHGADAHGGVTGVDLHEPGAMLELFEKVREGENLANPGARTSYMPAFDTTWLTDEEIQLIADHILTL
ncbi:MAG: cytochrome c [Myxococcales bacterium]|nr:cytochrome c [Myxococcales bacterium]